MKKTFKTMLAIVAGALCIAGCAKEEIIENIDNGPKLLTLTAIQEGGDATKAAIDAEDNTKIDWTADDQINYFGAATGEYMTLTNGAGTASGEFKGEVTPGTTNYVLYPYQSTATCAEGVITAEVPMTQYAVAGSFDPAAALMVGVVNGSKVEFKNVMSYVKVTIPSDMTNCKQVSLKAKDAWTTVAGKVNISAADATWAETDHKEGQAFVRLVPQDGDDYLTAGASYYITILPQDMTTGFELIFNDNDVIKVKQSSSSSVEFGRSKTKKLGAITSFTYTVGTIDWIIPNNATYTSLKMADRNIGAATAATTESTDYGDFFPWGGLRPQYKTRTPSYTVYSYHTPLNSDYSSYSYAQNSNDYVKYNSTDGKTVLEAVDDIASMLWGGDWRMATNPEWYYNRNNASITGLKCGYYAGSSHYNEQFFYSWTSTLSGEKVYNARYYRNAYDITTGDSFRSYYYCVRPVLSK